MWDDGAEECGGIGDQVTVSSTVVLEQWWGLHDVDHCGRNCVGRCGREVWLSE